MEPNLLTEIVLDCCKLNEVHEGCHHQILLDKVHYSDFVAFLCHIEHFVHVVNHKQFY